MSFDLIHAVQNLADFGLAVEPWIPQRADGNTKVQIGGGKARPIVKVVDLDLFRTAWPNGDAVVHQGLNGGQSLRVKLQGIIRPKVEKDAKISDSDLILAQLSSMLGVTAPVSAAVVLESTTDEALIAEIARRRGISLEDARALLA